jgi:1,3-beta-glucanosyltransferase GAS3
MTGVFSGGLAYEFTQEPNNYGLVSIEDTTAVVLNDFEALQSQYQGVSVSEGTVPAVMRPTMCPPSSSFVNLNGTEDLPETPASDLISKGISSSFYTSGKLITPTTWSTNYTIIDYTGMAITNKAINSDGFKPSNPSHNGAGSSGSQIGSGNKSNNVKSGAETLSLSTTSMAVAAAGVIAWSSLI